MEREERTFSFTSLLVKARDSVVNLAKGPPGTVQGIFQTQNLDSENIEQIFIFPIIAGTLR